MPRVVLHCDMDAFYAAIEQRDRPELRGKPVIVGGSPPGRGVVSAASYEARAFGVRSAMPTREAGRLCPQGIFLPVRMGYYARVGAQVRALFQECTPLVEAISIDEAFLDVTGSQELFGDGETIAREIKRRVRDELGLTVSVGVAPNKHVAKIASDLGKPDGLVVVPPDGAAAFLAPLPISRLWGVGPATERRLAVWGVRTIGHLAALDEKLLLRAFGTHGPELARLARGEDDRPVTPDRPRKSLGREMTFAEDVGDRETLETYLLQLCEEVARRLRAEGLVGRTVTLKLRTARFQTSTRARQLSEPTDLGSEIFAAARELLRQHQPSAPLRLIGASVSQLEPADEGQRSLFGQDRQRERRLAQAVDRLERNLGKTAVRRARLL